MKKFPLISFYTFLFISFLGFPAINTYAVSDTIRLQELIITGRKAPALYSELSRIVTIIPRSEIEKLPVQSIADVLEYVMSVDVRERGPKGVQADVSIRGGSFEQVLILLNGIKMNDPQTGHHHLNLPVELHNIERIEILEGPGSRIFGPYAYAGAINIITSQNHKNKISYSLTGGEYSFINGSLKVDFLTGSISHNISVNRKSNKGYIDNTDFEMDNIFYHASRKTGNWSTAFQAGYLNKEFGANSFYTPAFPDQFEAVRTLFASVNNTFGERVKFSHNIYFRRHHDRFELFRYEAPPWYRGHNYHKTSVYGTEGLLTIPWKFGTSAIGAEFRSEGIFSNVLGEPFADTIWINREENAFYSKFKERSNFGFFGEHNFYLGNFNFSAGLLGNFNEDFGWSIYPGMDLSYNLTDNFRLYLSYNHSLRMPSFTDLYYVGPSNLGNPYLTPETAINYETGLKYFGQRSSGHFLVFYREGENIIDWVRTSELLKWESRNLTELSTLGFDFKYNIEFSGTNLFSLQRISLGYSWTDVTKQSGNYMSVYALDMLRHKVNLSVNHKIFRGLTGSWNFSYQDRNGTFTEFPSGIEMPYKPFLTVDSRIIYRFKTISIFAEVSNLFNKSYFDFGNIPQPGRWIKFGFSGSVL